MNRPLNYRAGLFPVFKKIAFPKRHWIASLSSSPTLIHQRETELNRKAQPRPYKSASYHCYKTYSSASMASSTSRGGKKILLIGRVVHAHSAFESLSDVGELVVSS